MTRQDYNDKFLSINLKEMILEAGHNTTSFANHADLKESTVRNLCDPRTPFNPNAKTIVSLSEALNVPVSDIIRPESE